MAKAATARIHPTRQSWFDRILFVALTALLAVRPLLTEAYERVDLPFISSDTALGPTPAATAVLDFLTLAIGGAVLARRGWPARTIVAAVVALGLAVAISTLAADSKRVALNAGATLVVFAVAGAAVVRLADSRARATLLVAALLASVTTNAAKCMMQRSYEFDDTLQAWTEQKAAREARGETVNDAATENFERRMRSQNAFGYLAHPNVVASIMAAGAAVALLMTAAAVRNGGPGAAGLSFALAGIGVAGVWLTGSVGALAALAAGLIAIIPATLRWPARRSFRTLVSAYLLGVLALFAVGIARGTLPGESLAFRWEYWTSAAHALPESGATGLGRENFVTAHVLHKPPTATEEVRNPHNLWVSLWIELGPLGFAAGGVLIAAAVWAATRAAAEGPARQPSETKIARIEAAWIAAAVIGLHAAFSGTPFDKPGIAVLWFAELALLWTTAFAVAVFALALATESPRGARVAALGGVAAAGVLLVHNLVDFSLLTPSGLATLVVLALGFAGQAAPSAESARSRRAVWACGAAALVAALLHFALIVQPTVATEQLTSEADAAFAAARTGDQIVSASTIDLIVANADSLNGDAPRRAARRQLQLAHQANVPSDMRALFLTRAEQLAQLSHTRSPRSVPTKRLLARIGDATATADQPAGFIQAAKCWDDVTAGYPTSAQDHLDAGLAYFRLWQATHEPGPSGSALDHFQAALRIDAMRPKENASKLRPADLDQIQSALQEMQPEIQRRAEETP